MSKEHIELLKLFDKIEKLSLLIKNIGIFIKFIDKITN